ncbi:MAG: FMN-binding protein [Chloroflexi bacterium]|nr:FMN-binding protein [Chloroflexota bacterium]
MAIKGSVARLLGALLALAGVGDGFAERYLTVAETAKLCFPAGDRFETRIIRFSTEQAKAIAARSAVKVLNAGNRVLLAYQGTNLIGALIIDHVLGKHEIIDYGVAVSPDGKVLQVEILEYRESHGTEILSAKWRAQFTGKTAHAPLKLHDDIYNISGATISCRRVTEGIKRVLATYELVVRPRWLVAGGLPNSPEAAKP